MCVLPPAPFVAALLLPLDSSISKSPNILIEESSWFVVLLPAVQQQLRDILPVLSLSHTRLCVYCLYSSSSVSASTGYSVWLGSL